MQEKGRFPSQPHQNPKGIHEVEAYEGESSQRVKERQRRGKKFKEKKKWSSGRKEDHDSTVNEDPEKIVINGDMMKKHMPPHFPQALHGKKGISNASEILEVLRQVKVNIPLLDMIKQCKSLVKYKDPGCPTTSMMIGRKLVEKALLDLGASVNLLPYSIYKQLGLGELKPTSITLSLANRLVKIPRGMIEDVLVQKPINPEEEGLEEVCIIDTLVEEHCNQKIQEKLNESLRDLDEGLLEPLELLATLPPWRRIEEILPLFNEEEAQEAVKEEAPKLSLRPLPTKLKYAYLEENKKCPVVISSSLTTPWEECLLKVLRRSKKAIR
ncbi:hypothetical protein CK203_093670 [Vitis vinifera]|uniref:Aspartic peptidase DDI1-type domain-containing protein n=1 Tax=Vitis vinifera TaxID=29760 RepID=A0A438CIG9_VITVI|nr:hypothetical protein CK203_093670 [Vitis vinifera]